MVLGAFPVGKVIILGIKHIIKPVSQIFQTFGKRNAISRKFLFVPAGQFVYWAEVRIKMHMLKLPQPKRVPKLNEKMATDLGANILGEIFVLTIGVGLVYYEVLRQLRKDRKKHDSHLQERQKLTSEISTLTNLVEWQDKELRKVRRKLLELDSFAD